MNWRSLFPIAGIAAGVFTGLCLRSPSPQREKSRILSAPGSVSISRTEAKTLESAPVDLADAGNRWEAEGQLGLYASLEGVPPAVLITWLDNLQPPDAWYQGMALQKRRETREAVVERLAAADPVRLASWVQKLFRRDAEDLIREATRGLVAADTPEAAEALTKLKGRFLEAAQYELAALAEKDPAAAFELAQKQDPCRSIPPKLAAWLAGDPAKAIEFANRHPDCAGLTGPGAHEGVKPAQLSAAALAGDPDTFAGLCLQGGDPSGSFRTLVHAHPETVEEVARRLAEKPSLCASLWTTMAVIDPAKAASLLASPAFAGALKEITATRPYFLADWHTEDPAAAVAWVKSQPPEILAAVLPAAGQLITDLSAGEWISLAARIPVSKENCGSLATQAITKLPEPGMLAAWSQSLPENVRFEVLQRITDTLAGTDLSKATALALTPEDPQQQRRLLDSIKSNAVFDKSPAAAVAWADSLPAEWQASTITEVLPIMIQGASPEKTAQISDIVLQRINSEPPETASRWTGLAKDTVSRLASGDPAACELFLTKLPETARKTAIKAVTGQCCGFFTDPDRVESTLKWITGMNDAALRQTLSGSICGELAKQHLPPEVSQRVQQTLTPFIR